MINTRSTTKSKILGMPYGSSTNIEIDLMESVAETLGAAATSMKQDQSPLLTNGSDKKNATSDTLIFKQWSQGTSNTFYPATKTVKTLPSGSYIINMTNHGLQFKQMETNTDSLIELDDAPTQRVVDTIRNFWSKKEQYDKFGLLYRRGVILSGPAGGGKSSSIYLLTKELVENEGIVVYITNPEIGALGIQCLREIEKERPLICIFEDIDEIIDHYGEHALLALLDGEFQIKNVVNIASTNYPDKLGARIINRPSRFDEHIVVGMPSESARRTYLKHLTKQTPLEDSELEQWVQDTEKFSMAHVKELMVAVVCLGQPYDETLKRLKEMAIKPKGFKEFINGSSGLGFGE